MSRLPRVDHFGQLRGSFLLGGLYFSLLVCERAMSVVDRAPIFPFCLPLRTRFRNRGSFAVSDSHPLLK